LVSTTFSFTPKDPLAHYRLVDINAIFEAIETVLNAKLDVAEPEVVTNFNIGMQPILNVAESVDDEDVATSGELQDWAPVEEIPS
jgi:hypothetical protein